MAAPQFAAPHYEDQVWGGLALRGIVAILFGILALARPGHSAAVLVYIFGAYAFIDGIFALMASARIARLEGRWAPMFFGGRVGFVIGIVPSAKPMATAMGLVYYVAIWALLTGALEVIAAVRLRTSAPGDWLLALAGLLAIACGILLAARPAAGLL